MKRRLLILLTVAATLVPATSAHAGLVAGLPDPMTRALAVADAAWPDSPCRGHVNVTVVEELPAVDGQALDGLATGVTYYTNGTSVFNSCDISVLQRDVAGNADNLCDLIVHETGHLARAGHPGPMHDDTGIMAAVYGKFPACHQHTRRQAAFGYLSLILPDGPVWTVRCSAGETRCRAFRPGARIVRRYELRWYSSGTATITEVGR